MSSKKKAEFYLPYPVFDTHFHASHMKHEGDYLDDILPRAFNNNLVAALDVAIDEKMFSWRCKLADRFANLYLSAGIHPSSVEGNLITPATRGRHLGSIDSSTEGDAKIDWNNRFETIRTQCMHPAVIAIGETGLDFYRGYSTREYQEPAFRSHLELATETGLPVIVHNRGADEDILAIIGESACRHGIFHCFSSSWEVAKVALDLGYYISFAGNISYKNADEIRTAALRIPRNRLLIETDSPYLSPVPMRGRANHPGHIGYTLKALAELRGENIETLAESLVENAFELFGLPTMMGNDLAGENLSRGAEAI